MTGTFSPSVVGLARTRHVHEHAIALAVAVGVELGLDPERLPDPLRRLLNAGTICAWPSTNTGLAASAAACCAAGLAKDTGSNSSAIAATARVPLVN